MLHLKRTS